MPAGRAKEILLLHRRVARDDSDREQQPQGDQHRGEIHPILLVHAGDFAAAQSLLDASGSALGCRCN